MHPAECTRCGSTDLDERQGFVVCAYCQSKYPVQMKAAPAKETTIGIHSDIEQLLQKCRDDPANRRRYASLILDMDPTNQEASLFLL